MFCEICSAPIMGHGEDLTPLVVGRGCGNCALGAMHYRVHKGKDITREEIIFLCQRGGFLEGLRKHNLFEVTGGNNRGAKSNESRN